MKLVRVRRMFQCVRRQQKIANEGSVSSRPTVKNGIASRAVRRVCFLHRVQDVIFMCPRRTAWLPKAHQFSYSSETGEGFQRKSVDSSSIFGSIIKILWGFKPASDQGWSADVPRNGSWRKRVNVAGRVLCTADGKDVSWQQNRWWNAAWLHQGNCHAEGNVCLGYEGACRADEGTPIQHCHRWEQWRGEETVSVGDSKLFQGWWR